MRNKIILAIIITIVVIIPVAFADLKPTENRFNTVCDNKLSDGKFSFADFSCAVNIYQMYFNILDIEHRLQVLEGRADPPLLAFTMETPDSLKKGDTFTILGTADRLQGMTVNLHIFKPDGITKVNEVHVNVLQSNTFIMPYESTSLWNVDGDYIVLAYHRTGNLNSTISFLK